MIKYYGLKIKSRRIVVFFKLYGANISPACRVCERVNEKNGVLLCPIVGRVEGDGNGRKFKYDPLKREPNLPRELEEFDKSDFSIDSEESVDEA